MNTRPLHSNLLFVLLAGFVSMLAGHASAQTYTVLHNFTNSPDGDQPMAGLTLSGNTLYGTTYVGGSNSLGTVFKVDTDGTNYAVLKNFAGGSDGDHVWCDLTLSGNILFGTTQQGYTFSSYQGTVFAINTDGNGYSVLRNFTGSPPGSNPQAGITLSGDTLYGTTAEDFFDSYGTVFALSFTEVNNDGTIYAESTDYTLLKDFAVYTNTDGTEPVYVPSGLVLSGSTLYGTTADGGSYGHGTVFSVNTNGTGFSVIKSFDGTNGQYPIGTLVLSGNTLYGATSLGGTNGGTGTVFKINTDGSSFTVLRHVGGIDGIEPWAGLALSGRTLYGTTDGGGALSDGSTGFGTIFAINTDGTGFTVLKTLTADDGRQPQAKVTVSGNTLYGTTSTGGIEGYGTVFKLVFPITLFYQNTGSDTVLSWNDPSFVLQVAPAVTGTYTNIPGATSPYTNAFTGPQQFFRLLVSQ
jgi:uncharacterized repeat protein (TIGR03803 family)